MRVPLRKVIQDAYGSYNDNLLSGGPPWLNSDKFDIEAKFSASEVPDFEKLTLDQRQSALQALLADRFKLKIHHESKEFPVYALAVAKGGSKLLESKSETHDLAGTVNCHITRSRTGILEVKECSMAGLTSLLRYPSGRTVVDKTGLPGRYDFSLRWTPDDSPPSTSLDSSGPSLFTAVQEQLGLKLEPTKAPFDTIVVDSVEMPTEN